MRIWHGLTREKDGDAYFRYILEPGFKFYRNQGGNRGVYVLRQIKDGKADFVLLSLWDSLAAIKKFTGSEVDKALYLFPLFPQDRSFLLEMEPYVRHYEVIAGSVEQKSRETRSAFDDQKCDFFLII